MVLRLETKQNLENSASKKDWSEFRSAEHYRDFLKIYIENRGIPLSTLAQSAGFHRSFPSDVLLGRRRLTAKSCHAFEKAMKIPQTAKKLFRLLVAQAEPDEFPELDAETLKKQIFELKTKPWIRSRKLRESEAPQAASMFTDSNLMSVYAASGSPGQGASFTEIQKRTRILDRELIVAIEKLLIMGLLAKKENLFVPQDLHLFLKSEGKNEILKNAFQRAVKLAGERVEKSANSPSEMFFTSSFCVTEARLAELKEALRETILKFVDDSIEASGDRVVHLLTSLHL